MRQIVSAACGLWLCLAGQGGAQSGPGLSSGAQTSSRGVVVELFTSQGCVACPPADAFLARLARDPDVIALSLHVDYWDYIGWQDSFGDARYTERQKAYARAIGSRMIYTPQMIVDGLDRVEGNQPEQVEHVVRARMAVRSAVALRLVRQDGKVAIRAEADPPLDSAVGIELVRYRPSVTVGIERGENAGLTVEYTNIVTSWQSLGDWDGATPLDMSVPVQGTDPVVVILQKPGPGEIVAAARLTGTRADGAADGASVAAGGEGLAMREPARARAAEGLADNERDAAADIGHDGAAGGGFSDRAGGQTRP